MTPSLIDQYPTFFDLDFVREQNPQARDFSDDQLLAGLVDRQNLEPFNPNPIFECRYYSENAALGHASQACNPIVHFLEQGDFEGLQPNLFFCPTYYRRHNPEARARGVNSVAHALKRGLSSLTCPHLLVDLDHIRSQVPEAEVETVAQKLFTGALGRVDPHPLFSIRCLERAAGRRFSSVSMAFAFYMQSPDDLQTHPLLDPTYHAEQLGSTTIARKALEHYLEGHGGYDPHPLFDSTHYRSQVFNQRGSAVDTPLLHFAKQSARSQLSPSPYFDLPFYLEVSQCGDDAFGHYLLDGGFRHYPPHPLIDLDDHYAASAAGLALSEIPAVDVALRVGAGKALGINLVDASFLDGQSCSNVTRSISPIEAYFSEGLAKGALPSEMFSLPYVLRSVSANRSCGGGAVAHYFASGLHKRARILFALPNLEPTAENSAMLELLRVLSKMPEMETITLSERPGGLEQDFRAYSHVQVLERDEPSTECAEQTSLEHSVDAFLRVLGANAPAIAFCDQPEQSQLLRVLAAREIPVVPIVGRLGESWPDDQLPGLFKSSSTILFHSPAGLESARLTGVLPLPLSRSPYVQFVRERPGRPSEREGARRRLGVPADAKVVLGGGGLTLDAGLEEFVSIARRYLNLADDGDGTDDLYFVWAGEGPTQPHSLHFYVSLHNRLCGREQRIVFAPSDMSMHVLGDAADVILQPGSPDPAVTLMLEAMASGCPMVISSATGGCDDLFDPAFCFSYGDCDLDAACEALRSLLQDQELYGRSSASGREKIAVRWGFDALVNRFIEAIQRHASKPIQLPRYQSTRPREWAVYMRGRMEEFAAFGALREQIGVKDWKLICVDDQHDPETDDAVAALAPEEYAIYQPADDEEASLSSVLKTAIFDHACAKSVFLNLQNALSAHTLQRCVGQRLLLLTGHVDVTGQLYDLGLLFDEIFVEDAGVIERMRAVNPLIASRMVILESGVDAKHPVRSNSG